MCCALINWNYLSFSSKHWFFFHSLKLSQEPSHTENLSASLFKCILILTLMSSFFFLLILSRQYYPKKQFYPFFLVYTIVYFQDFNETGFSIVVPNKYQMCAVENVYIYFQLYNGAFWYPLVNTVEKLISMKYWS